VIFIERSGSVVSKFAKNGVFNQNRPEFQLLLCSNNYFQNKNLAYRDKGVKIEFDIALLNGNSIALIIAAANLRAY
jgi:hypothetical protein